jgi:hypothetical protein
MRGVSDADVLGVGAGADESDGAGRSVRAAGSEVEHPATLIANTHRRAKRARVITEGS